VAGELARMIDARDMHPAHFFRLLALAATLTAPSSWGSGGTRTHETPIVVRVDEHGFAWTDAVVGVVAGIGVTLVTAGGVVLVRLRRSVATTAREKA
jgi:hypothetical protein